MANITFTAEWFERSIYEPFHSLRKMQNILV